ncbi:MAG: CoB--CoM heterodisulfide reductase iron-sulfur subunit B family protein [Candidatus Hodarchaeales archaeon]
MKNLNKEYAFFLGCLIPSREPSYELSSRKVGEILGLNLVDMENTTCCGPTAILSMDYNTSYAISARNICIAEEMGCEDLVTLCNGCYEQMKRVNDTLKSNEYMREDINEILKEVDMEFKGTTNVRHYAEVLYEDIGINTIKENVKRPLDGLKVAVRYGCHLIRPSEVTKIKFDKGKMFLDELVESTGARSIEFMNKFRCCGGMLRGVGAVDTSDLVLDERLVDLKDTEANCLTTVCPLCFLQFDIGQYLLVRKKKDTDKGSMVPVVHYPQLLGLALGLDSKDLGLNTHRTKFVIEE